jgi:hypothetical protein
MFVRGGVLEKKIHACPQICPLYRVCGVNPILGFDEIYKVVMIKIN